MNSLRSTLLLCLLAFAIAYPSQSQTSGFTVPTTHPRLWWNTERLAQAKTWYATHPFNPSASDMYGNALRYILSNQNQYARKAIDLLMQLQLPAGQVLPTAIGCDACRGDGENAILVYDWCYDQMTTQERATIITRWNKYLNDVNQQDWGGVGMEANNYYWGNLRNSLEWGIATFHENNQAQSFLDHGLNTRWAHSFIPYASTAGKGGAPGEGPEYGSTMMWYPLVPFTTVGFLGRPIYNESNFFKEAVMHIIYATTPAPIIKTDKSFYGFFPYNETDINDLLHDRIYYGDFMQTMASYWRTTPVAQYARTWMDLTRPATSRFTDAVNQTVTPKSFADLPLDYYASGVGVLYSRNKWDANATALQIQLRDVVAVGHAHRDYGNFQLFRKGRWLTKETSGYSDMITGVNGREVDVNNPDAHNTIFVGTGTTMKSLVGDWQTAGPLVTRLESHANYTYASVNMTDSYQSAEKPEVFENPYVDKIVREYIFVKPMETLVVFDRIQSKSKSIPASNVTKMALIHFETTPTIENETHVSAALGNQVVRLTTLVPSNPVYRVVNEGAKGQFRLQITTSGQEQSYFVNVIHGRDAAAENVEATVIESAMGFDVTLSHPTLGKSIIKLQKGALSTGGSLGYAASGSPTLFQEFTTAVAAVTVTDNGPAWGAGNGSGIPVGLEDENLPNWNVRVYPNPVNTTLYISAHLSGSDDRAPLNIGIYNSQGKPVEVFRDIKLSSTNDVSITWNTKDVPAGIYVVLMNYGGRTISRKVLVGK